ncbi:polynucleotide 5'-hydroxyl-kinase GRC3/NOL9, partial [Tremellales sp. Uapishka_1]
MSALAARRAAAAARVASMPSRPVQKAPQKAEPVLEAEVQFELSEESEEDQPGPSTKRERIIKSPPVKPRYFAAVHKEEKAEGRSRKKRRFSPSAPASDAGSDGENSSSEEALVEEAEEEVDEGRVRWSVPATPLTRPAYDTPRGKAREDVAPLGPVTSNFSPIEGDNVYLVGEAQLRAAGLQDDISGPGMVVSLGPDEDLLIAGTYTLTPLSHSVSLLSTNLSPNHRSYPVFAPTSHPIPVLTHVPSAASSSPLLTRLALQKSFKISGRSVFLVREHRSGIEGLRGGIVPGFGNIFLEDRGAWGIRGVHPVIGSFPTPVYPHTTPPSWSSSLAALSSSPSSADTDQPPFVALLKGPKRSGKSSFARATLNRLLSTHQRVAWLETDLGQGEFGCGGVVGLWILDAPVLGPSFTHSRVPLRAHYLGSYTAQTCPDEYIDAIRHLVSHYRYEIQYSSTPSSAEDGRIQEIVPLIVNTPGWVKGLGEDLLRAIEGIAEPTHIFAFAEPEPTTIPQDGGWTSSPTFHQPDLPPMYPTSTSPPIIYTLEQAPVSPLQARYTPADLRILSTISYFHSDLAASWDFSRPLLAFPPWQVSLGTTLNRVILVGEGGDGVLPQDLPLALNGSVVALLEHLEEESPKGDMYQQGATYPVLDETNFLGLALIRGINGSEIHLSTPLPLEKVIKAKIVVKNGAIEMPTCGLMDWRRGAEDDGIAGVKWDDVPFLESGGVEGVGGGRRRFRRNLQRKGH